MRIASLRSHYRSSRVLESLAFALALWTIYVYLKIGLLAVPFEGDDISIVAGALCGSLEGSFNKGWSRFETLKGLHWGLLFAHRSFGLDPFVTFHVLSAFGWLGGVLIWTRVFARRLGASWALLIALAFSIQEVSASALYANDMSIVLFLSALSAVAGPSASPVFLALAMLVRFDAVALLPALCWLRETERGVTFDIRRWVTRMIAWGLVMCVAMFAAGINPWDIWHSYAWHREFTSSFGDVRYTSWRSIALPFTTILVSIGFVQSLRRSRMETLAPFLLCLAPYVVSYGGTLTTPKYLLLPLMFSLPLQALAIRSSMRHRAILGALCALAAYQLLHVRPLEPGHYGGKYAWTHDGPRYGNGTLRIAGEIHRFKLDHLARINRAVANLGAWMSAHPGSDRCIAPADAWPEASLWFYEAWKAGWARTSCSTWDAAPGGPVRFHADPKVPNPDGCLMIPQVLPFKQGDAATDEGDSASSAPAPRAS